MAFYKVTKKQSGGGGGTTILSGTTNPTSAQGSNGQLYLKYGADNRYTYDEDLGGYVLSDYYIHDQGTYLATQSAAFYKTYDGGAITVYWNVSPWYGPIAISTVADNVRFSSNAIGGSVDIDGVTWYISTNEAWSSVYDQNHAFPILEANYVPNDSDANRRKAIEDILAASDYGAQPVTTIINDTFAKVSGSWQSLVGTDVGDISNVTTNTVSIYKGSTAPSSSLGADGNVYFQYGVLDAALLHFEDSATTDEFNNTTWTAEGTATISADQHKFGSKSLYLNGSGYLRSPVGDDMFNFGSGDFTVSMWIYPLFASRYALFSMSYDCRIGSDIFQGKGSANMWMSSDGSWNVIQSDNDTATSGMGDIALNANEWTHIAYIRSGDTCKIFVNGQLAKATNVPSGTSVYWTGNDFFQIGRWAGGSYMFNGYIDELLVMKGIAYWDSAFTPPTQPFSVSDFTNVVVDSYAKDNGSWQSLRGTPIDDIAGTVEPT